MADFLDDNADDPWAFEPKKPEAEVELKPEPITDLVDGVIEPEQAPENEEQKKERFDAEAYREEKKYLRRAQEAERELAELRAQSARPKQEPTQAPDPYEDPVGYNAYVQQTVQATEWKMRAEMSGRFAEQVHGKEKVEAAVAWAQEQGVKDPTLGQRVQAQTDPVGFVVQEYERSRTLQTLDGKSLEDFAKDYAAKQGWIVSEPGAAAPILKPSSPVAPKGLSSAPGKGGVGQVPQGADWGEVKFALDR